MASAGRILIMPKGNYDSSATYNMLDMVYHNGTSWLAKKTVTGIEPSVANSEHWHCLLDFDPNDIETRKADCGTVTFIANPEGKDYIDYSFELPHAGNVNVFANTSNTDSVFAVGVCIVTYEGNTIYIRIKLNQAVNQNVHIGIGYLYL